MTRFGFVASMTIRQSAGKGLGQVSDQGCQFTEK